MNKKEWMVFVERLVQEGYITGPVTCRYRARIDFHCIDVDKQTLEDHLRQNNPHQKEPDVRPLSNGMFVAIPRASNLSRTVRARQLLEALDYPRDDRQRILSGG